MKHNTMKRALALTLSVLTVAAPMSANVGGILQQEVAIVASAALGDYITNNTNTASGILKVEDDAKAFIEGVYEISVDAGKYVYTKVATSTTDLNKDKAYILRTTAYVVQNGLIPRDKDLNEGIVSETALPDGVYEYEINKVTVANTVVSVDTLKTNIDVGNVATFAEQLTVTQNGKEIIWDTDKKYQVAQGYPVAIAATPGEIHTNEMMTVSTNNATVKSQTKANDVVTLTIVPTKNTTSPSTTSVAWAEYTPTLELTNVDGTIKATDVGFNNVINNATVGTYQFRFGSDNGNFTEGEVNAKGEYIADGTSKASPLFKSQTVKVGNTTYNYVKFGDGTGTGTISLTQVDKYEKWDEETQKWTDTGITVDSTDKAGKYRVTTYVVADKTNATLTVDEFKIVTEFTVVAQAVTGAKNLVFVAPSDDGNTRQVIDPKNGVYNVPWQNGKEITPNILLYVDPADAALVKTANAAAAETAEAAAQDSNTFYREGSKLDYIVTGTTKAAEAGTYTMTITPVDKKFNDGEEIIITWQIVNTNNYVIQKKTPSCKSNDNYSSNSTSNNENVVKEQATTNAQNFTIGYRQASNKSIVEKIIKSLNFVGNTDLTVVEYRKVTWATKPKTNGQPYEVEPTLDANGVSTGAVVDDPSEEAGTYVAYVANALKNDGKTSAMMKDNNTYNGGKLYPVYFQVTKTRVRIVPDVTEITYGDDVKLSKLYKVIDADTKEEIGVPWATAPEFTLTDKYSETNQLTTKDGSTKELAAGEYEYGIADGVSVLDDTNYDVRELIAEDQTDFTVNPRNLDEMEFGAVNVKVENGAKNVTITKRALAEAANDIEANPVDFAYTYTEAYAAIQNPTAEEEFANRVSTNDFNITGGTTSAKATDLGKTLTVNIKGTGNFTGTKAVTWIVGDSKLNDKVMSYEAEFDASKPRVMAKFDINQVDGEIEECGFYYNNNGKMNDIPLDGQVNANGEAVDAGGIDAQVYLTELFKQVDKTGANMNQKGCKKVGFSEKAIASAKSGKGLVTAEIANSSVLKQVYIMPYVKYTNGNVAYGKVESFNYYDMVLAAEGALEMTKTDFVGDGTTGTKGQTYVKVDVTRVDKKGYEVERYGILYNNSDSWQEAANKLPSLSVASADQGANAKVTLKEAVNAYNWLNIDYESEKTVKVAEVPAKDLATKIGTNTYIANTTAKKVDANGKVTKDYGYGAKTVFAKAFIKIKDAAGNEKVYYSHLADVTYGGFTVNAKTGVVNGVESGNAVTDSKNTTQIQFYAPTKASVKDEGALLDAAAQAAGYALDKDGVKLEEKATYNQGAEVQSNLTRMSASTGNKTFFVDWTDSKKS